MPKDFPSLACREVQRSAVSCTHAGCSALAIPNRDNYVHATLAAPPSPAAAARGPRRGYQPLWSCCCFEPASSAQAQAQAPDAVEPLVAPSPGVAGLLRLFACDPGTTSLACHLAQLRPAVEAVFAPVPEALAAEARLLADVPLGTLPSGTSKPCMAFAASQVRVCCLALASALLG